MERNYNIYNKELLIIIRMLKVWYHYLEDIKKKIKIITNHKYFTIL